MTKAPMAFIAEGLLAPKAPVALANDRRLCVGMAPERGGATLIERDGTHQLLAPHRTTQWRSRRYRQCEVGSRDGADTGPHEDRSRWYACHRVHGYCWNSFIVS